MLFLTCELVHASSLDYWHLCFIQTKTRAHLCCSTLNHLCLIQANLHDSSHQKQLSVRRISRCAYFVHIHRREREREKQHKWIIIRPFWGRGHRPKQCTHTSYWQLTRQHIPYIYFRRKNKHMHSFCLTGIIFSTCSISDEVSSDKTSQDNSSKFYQQNIFQLHDQQCLITGENKHYSNISETSACTQMCQIPHPRTHARTHARTHTHTHNCLTAFGTGLPG